MLSLSPECIFRRIADGMAQRHAVCKPGLLKTGRWVFTYLYSCRGACIPGACAFTETRRLLRQQAAGKGALDQQI